MTIRINAVEIPEAAVAAEMQYHPADRLETARDAAATALAIRELLRQEADRLAIEAADEAARLDALLARELRLPTADEATCRRYYEANRHRFRSPELFEAAHILFAAAPEDAAARSRAREQAMAALATLRRAPERFADLARAHSACQSAGSGGRLGQVSRGDTVEELESFLLALEEGQLCPVPVETRYGVHVLRLDRRLPGRELPFEAMRERIADYLAETAWRRAVSQYIRILAGRAEIDGIELGGATTPLVQ